MKGRIAVSDSFYLDEFIPPDIYRERGARSISLIDQRIIIATQFLREQFNVPVIVNNWFNGGRFQESGLRSPLTRTGAKWSQHKFGRASDLKCSLGPTKMKEILLEHEQYLIENQLITTVENVDKTPTWLHIDCRYTGLKKIQFVDP